LGTRQYDGGAPELAGERAERRSSTDRDAQLHVVRSERKRTWMAVRCRQRLPLATSVLPGERSRRRRPLLGRSVGRGGAVRVDDGGTDVPCLAGPPESTREEELARSRAGACLSPDAAEALLRVSAQVRAFLRRRQPTHHHTCREARGEHDGTRRGQPPARADAFQRLLDDG